MKAREANERTLKAIEELVPICYNDVLKEISDQAFKGYFELLYYKNYNEYVYEKVKDFLKMDGYKVNKCDDEYGDGLIISWKKVK